MSYEEFIVLNDRIEAGEPVSVEMMAEVFGDVVYDIIDLHDNMDVLDNRE